MDECFYRLTAKAIIYDTTGKVLLLREAGGEWGLPGGGVEHGQDIVTELGRELHEELGITKVTSTKLMGARPFFSVGKQNWWLWLLYRTTVELPANFVGELAHGAEFIDIATFKDSTDRAEQRIYQALSKAPH